MISQAFTNLVNPLSLIFEKTKILRESDLCCGLNCVSLCKSFIIKVFKENKKPLNDFRDSVIRSGLEPETYCLEGSCSIQLSYRTDLIAVLRVQR